MYVRLAKESDRPAWDKYVLAHKEGLAYHQYAWRMAVAAAYQFEACYLMAFDDSTVCGVLPLIRFRRPMRGFSYVSLPYCDQAGSLADSPAVESALLARACEMAREDNVEVLELRQRAARNRAGTQARSVAKVRMVLELPSSAELLRQGMKAKLRSQVFKPLRDGLAVRLGGLELVPDFYQIFCANMRDLGSPVHSRQWMEAIVRHYAANAKVGLVITPQGEPAAGGIILLHGKTVSIPWASSLRKFHHLNPNMLLYWFFLAYAAEQGFSRFDFGRSTPGQGTYHFKKQWGAIPVALDWKNVGWHGEVHPVVPSGSGMRRRAEIVWTRMPLGLCNAFGPLVRKYVSL